MIGNDKFELEEIGLRLREEFSIQQESLGDGIEQSLRRLRESEALTATKNYLDQDA